MKRPISFFLLLILPLGMALLLSFLFIGIGIRSAVSDLLYASMDATLNERSEAIASAINGFETVVATNDRNADRFIQFIQDMVADPNHDDLSAGTVILIHDAQGNLIASNRDATVAGITMIQTGKAVTFNVKFQNGVQIPMRFIRHLAPQRKPLHLVISVGRQVDVIDAADNQMASVFLRIMVPSLLVLFIFLLLLSSWLTKPLTLLLREIGGVEADNLHRSVASNSVVRELGELTAQFNRMLERLDMSFALQKRFVADVSHQLRTPLAVMSGQIQTLLAQPRDNVSYREIMESNVQEIRELDHLLDVLLNLARLEARDGGERQMSDLSQLVRQMVEDFALVAESRNCRLECDFPELPHLPLDRPLVRQALVNLFDNATKYAQAGTSSPHVVRLETGIDHDQHPHRSGKPTVDRVWFRTTNWGPVIPGEEIQRLGERFFRGRSNTQPGFGLGLSLVNLVAAMHQGELAVSSDAALGTNFKFVLPVSGRDAHG